jgi:hypothetical protein
MGLLGMRKEAKNGRDTTTGMGDENETCKIPDEARHAVML